MGAQLSAAWVSLIRLPFLSLEHHLSRFLNKLSLHLGFGNFQQELCKEQGWQAAEAGQQEGGEGDMHTVIDMESWQLLHLAWLHRAADACKAGAEEEPGEEWVEVWNRKWFRSGWWEEWEGIRVTLLVCKGEILVLVVEILGWMGTWVLGHWTRFSECGRLWEGKSGSWAFWYERPEVGLW